MTATPVGQVRGMLGLGLGVGVTAVLLYLAADLSPLGRATGFVVGPFAAGIGAAIGAVVGGLAAFGVILFAIASGGFAMGPCGLSGGESPH